MTSEVPALPGLTDLSLLGRGGLADVYLARQQHLERWVAAKVFRVTLADDQAAERFRAECRAIGRLDQYPHVLTVYDAGVLDDGRPYLISERCDGSLHDLVGMRGPLPVDRVAALGSTIGRALRFAHSAGVLHGDVTPQNLLLRTSGAPVLADFGLAVLRDHAPTAAGFTLLHAAPEALRTGAVIDERADVYGLGSTLYTVLTGVPPFPPRPGEDDAAYRSRTHDEPAARPEGVTDQIAGLLCAMLAADPDHRPSTDEVITALETTPGRGTRPARTGGTLVATSPQPDPPSAEPVAVPVATRTRAARPRRGASVPRPWDTRMTRSTRTGANRPVAVPAGPDPAGQGSAGQGSTGPDLAGQGSTGHGSPGQDPAGHGSAVTTGGAPLPRPADSSERGGSDASRAVGSTSDTACTPATGSTPRDGSTPHPRPAGPPEHLPAPGDGSPRSVAAPADPVHDGSPRAPERGGGSVRAPAIHEPGEAAAHAPAGHTPAAHAPAGLPAAPDDDRHEISPEADRAGTAGCAATPAPIGTGATTLRTGLGTVAVPERWAPTSTLAFTSDAYDPTGYDVDVVAAPVRIPGRRRRRRARGGRALLAAGGATAVLAAGTGGVAAWRMVDDVPERAPSPSRSVPPNVAQPPTSTPRTTPADLPPAADLPGSTLGVVPRTSSAAPAPSGRATTPQRSGTRAPSRRSPDGAAQREPAAGRAAPAPRAPAAPRRTATPAPGAATQPGSGGPAYRSPAARPSVAPAAPATPAPQPMAQGRQDPTQAPRPEIRHR